MSVESDGDGRIRCGWSEGSQLYRDYHDREWGRPLHGDDALFARMCLEAFQSGLAWITILRKRPAFRTAFEGFVIGRVAEFTDADVERLMADPGIVRNRAKILASIHNARVARDLGESLDALLWTYAPAPSERPRALSDVPAVTAESTALAKNSSGAGSNSSGPPPPTHSCRPRGW